jgi:hypothetical protein
VRRAPVKEPAQRAPERSAPDASGAGGLRHEKAARPVWIGLARAGRTWHPATARIDRPTRGVRRAARTRSTSPRRRPTDRLQTPSTNRPAALGPFPDGLRIGPHALFRWRAQAAESARRPLSDPPARTPKDAERTNRNGESSRGWLANPSRRTGRNGVSRFRLCRRRRTTTEREPGRGPQIRRTEASQPFAAAAACPTLGALRNLGRAERATRRLPTRRFRVLSESFSRNLGAGNPVIWRGREIPVYSSRGIAQMPHSFSTGLSTSAARARDGGRN